MGGAGGVVGWAFGVHPSLILRPWGDDRLRCLQSLTSLLVFPLHYIFVLSEHYSVRRKEARLFETCGGFPLCHPCVIRRFPPRVVLRMVTKTWFTITMVNC
jgi:hypothetical protein